MITERWTYRCVIILSLVILTVAVLLTPAGTRAQESVTLRIDRVDVSAFPDVSVYVTVRNAFGVPIRDLQTEQFDVTEDRASTSPPITGLSPVVDEDQGVSLMLVIDSSGSMEGEPLQDARTAAVRLLDQLGPQDQAGVLTFADAVNLDEPFPQFDPSREHDFTTDRQPLYELVDGLSAGGNTPLYDAAYKAVRLAAREPAGSRAVLLLTDGRDEMIGGPRGSGSAVADEDTPIREANRARVPVFTIGLGEEIDEAWLRRLALETGGTYQQTPDSAQLAGSFQNVLQLLKQQYRLTYTSEVPEDGQEHSVRVRVTVGDAGAFDETRWGPAPLAPTATIAPSPSPAPTEPPPPTGTPAPDDPSDTSGIMSPLMVAGGLGALILAGVAVIGVARMRRRDEATLRCLNCGRALPEAGAPCPHCGAAGEYRDT